MGRLSAKFLGKPVNHDRMSALYERGLVAMLLENTHAQENPDFCTACHDRLCHIGTNHRRT
jgi:hypothetical protein